jgi:subtilisin
MAGIAHERIFTCTLVTPKRCSWVAHGRITAAFFSLIAVFNPFCERIHGKPVMGGDRPASPGLPGYGEIRMRKNHTRIILALLVCSLCVAGVSAVPVIVGVKNTHSSVHTFQAGPGLVKASAANTGTSYTSLITAENVTHTYRDINAVAMDISEEEIEKLQADAGLYVEPDYPVRAMGPPVQWNIADIHADVVQAAHNNGSGVRVALIDSGIDYNHPDLTGVYAGGYNTLDARHPDDPMDDYGHGTECAGILAAAGTPGGMYGTAPGVSLYAVKVLDNTGGGSVSSVIEGISWAKKNNMTIISMSLGGTDYSEALCDAVVDAEAGGILVVAAAGNLDYPAQPYHEVMYPAKCRGALAVASVNSRHEHSWFSRFGEGVGISAPGENITSTYLNGKYRPDQGTSMATPEVAGVAALVYSAHPDWTSEQVKQKMISTATPLGNTTLFGAGLVNASAALDMP